MRKLVCRTLGRLLCSARAYSQGGSRLDTGSASLGASHSSHSGAGEAHWCTCSDIPSFQPHSQTLQARPAHSNLTRTCCPSLAHGSSFCQQRSFASNGRDDTDTSQQLGPPGPSGVSQPPPSEREGSSVGQTPQQSSAAESDVRHLSDSAASADLSGTSEGQGAQSEADAESRDPWALTEEQRQAERVLLSPPSGEPLYPAKRSSLAWEPFSDDSANEEMTNYGGQIDSIDEYDEMLDRWGEMLEAGDSAGALEMLDQRLPELPEGDDLEDYLSKGNRREEIREQRRVIETALQQEYAARRVRTVDEQGRAYATGKRKTSVARVWIWEGPGAIQINGRSLDMCFPQLNRRAEILSPFQVTNTLGFFNVWATVKGGGIMGQAQAVRHGISCALQKWDPDLRPPLRQQGYLTRDPRVVERKKPGRAKARKAFQWVKR